MSRFIGDAKDFRQPGEPRLLVIASDLLDELGVFDCERDVQQRAVGGWLRRNEPNQVLAISLRKAGFLGENVSNNLSNEPRRTGPDGAGSEASANAGNPHDSGRRRTRRHRPGPGSSVS